MKNKSIFLLVFSLSLFFSAVSVAADENDGMSALVPRSIGPANMSGRLTAIAVSPQDPNIIYLGSATGGLWKTVNGGISWLPIFDREKTSSIGSVAIDPQNPNIIWVGTGEANPRNSVGVGRGVYKSLDGGRNWQCLGLEKTEKISRIRINPLDPRIVFVAALGTTWNHSEHRGVYKTLDGGKSWRKVKYVNDLSGVADLAMNPENPNHLLASFWEHQRWPWFFKSGGKGSGLHVSWDGGESWQQLDRGNGMPEGELGRIGIAFAPSRPRIVYALVEAEKNVLLRSSDYGRSWQTVNSGNGVGGRPFYYCDIRVNPANENIVYSLESSVQVSEDGGKSFRPLSNWAQSHPDYHAMWISPDGNQLIIGNDGGLVISRDRGENFRFIGNLPLAQFYHVSYDMAYPYNVYGGLQDNGSWKGPSTVLTDRAIYPEYWTMVGFGDGFDTEPDPKDPDCGYAMSQGGALFYYNSKTASRLDIRPTESEIKHRYSWNAALAIDPFKPETIYYGSQFVHRSPDKGLSWEIISPDLTTNDPEKQQQDRSGGLTPDVTAAENHTTIICIAPSQIKEGLIWVATDDGNIQVTRDNGKNWQRVSDSLTGSDTLKQGEKVRQPISRNDSSQSPPLNAEDPLSVTARHGSTESRDLSSPPPMRSRRSRKTPVPHGSTASYIEPSKFDPATAYAVFEDHQRSNWTPYVFVTRNYGKTWHSLASRDIDGFCHVIKEDSRNPNLLFLGTEFGLYYSRNAGKNWSRWTNGFPTVPVREIQIHPREDDLIVATHGRALFIFDHIASLREMTPEIEQRDLHLFGINPSHLYQPGWGGAFVSPGDGTFAGTNRPIGVFIDYIVKADRVKDKPAPKPILEILDDQGKTIRTITLSSSPGLNRFIWDMREKGIEGLRPARKGQDAPPGLLVLPGIYTVKLSLGDKSVTRPVEIKADPRLPFDPQLAAANRKLSQEMNTIFSKGFKEYRKLKKHLETLAALRPLLLRQISRDPKAKPILEQLSLNEKKIRDLIDRMMPEMRGKGINARPDCIAALFFDARGSFNDNFGPIPQNAQVKMNRAQTLLQTWLTDVDSLQRKDLLELQSLIGAYRIPLFDSADEEAAK